MSFNQQSVRNFLCLRLLFILLSCLLLNTCAKEHVAEPMCRMQENVIPAPSAPAACLVKLDTKLLVINLQSENGWQLPEGNLNSKKSAQCTAHQAVWQNTGLNVEVGQLLITTPDNLHIYNCVLSNSFDELTQNIPVPDWAHRKVRNISFVNPYIISPRQWSQKSDLILVRNLFNKKI